MPKTRVLEFKYQSASCTLSIWDETQATLGDVYSTDRMKGYATKLLELVTAFTDRRGLKLITGAEPYGDEPRMTTEQLVAFYAKFGFVDLTVDPKSIYMERQPK